MFRFTIRDLLWLMVVVGLACGWIAHDFRWRAALQDAIRFYGGETVRAQREQAKLTDARTKLEKENAALKRQIKTLESSSSQP
jgi:cell division protein FtsB